MELSIGIDVHKDSCTAYATYSGINKPRQRNLDLIERFNEEFKKFPSDGRGILNLHNSVKEHEVHILMENSTKTHDLYWMLKGLGHEVIVAHATDLKRITESHKKNDRNDAYELAHYMRRRLLGENEFNESYIPSLETLKRREMCRFSFTDRQELSDTKRRIRAVLLIRGKKLSREYSDILAQRAVSEMLEMNDTILSLHIHKALELHRRIRLLEKLLTEEFRGNGVADIIYSIPGFGIISTAYVTCMGDQFSRFKDGRSFAASIGLVPKQRASSDSDPECGITRRGDPDLRRILTQATFVHIRFADSFITRKYNRLKSRGKKHNEALVACANSMARLVYKLVTSGTRYTEDPEKLSKARMYEKNGNIEEDMEASE